MVYDSCSNRTSVLKNLAVPQLPGVTTWVGLVQTSMSAPEDAQVNSSPSAPPDPFQEEQTVLILVGLIASGKVESQTVCQ